MKHIKRFTEQVSKPNVNIGEMQDYLKASCRSWEQDCDNYDDTITLTGHLQQRFPNLSFDDIFQVAKDWTGYEENQEEDEEVNEAFIYGGEPMNRHFWLRKKDPNHRKELGYFNIGCESDSTWTVIGSNDKFTRIEIEELYAIESEIKYPTKQNNSWK